MSNMILNNLDKIILTEAIIKRKVFTGMIDLLVSSLKLTIVNLVLKTLKLIPIRLGNNCKNRLQNNYNNKMKKTKVINTINS